MKNWETILKKSLKVGLVEGRHPLPVEEYIFESLPKEGTLKDKIPRLTTIAEKWIEDKGQIGIDLYITGMTPISTAFLKAWKRIRGDEGELMLYHYDISTKDYWAEKW